MADTMLRSANVTQGVERGRSIFDKVLLGLGVFAPLYYVVVNDLVAASFYPGYDRVSRPTSELSATYAPSRPILVPLLVVYFLLMIAFWIGVWRAAQNNRALRITTGLMLGSTVLGSLIFPFPMTTNEPFGANLIHSIIFGAITPLLLLAAIAVSAMALGKRFRLFAILSFAALVGLSAWSGIQLGQVQAGGTAPWFGITERALIGVSLVWMAVLSITLLRPRPASSDG